MGMLVFLACLVLGLSAFFAAQLYNGIKPHWRQAPGWLLPLLLIVILATFLLIPLDSGATVEAFQKYGER